MDDNDNSKNIFSLEDYNPKKLDRGIKNGFRTVMANIATIIAVLSVTLLIAIFLFDIDIDDLIFVSPGMVRSVVIDALITVILYISMQSSMQTNGARSGQDDAEYVESRTTCMSERKIASDAGCPRMSEFCDDYVARELAETRRKRLSRINIKYDEWQRHFSALSRRQIKRLPRNYQIISADGRVKEIILNRVVKVVLINVGELSEQLLTPEMILYDDVKGEWRRSPILMSPEEKLRHEAKKNYIPTVIMAIFTALIVFKLAVNPTPETIVYCLFKLFGMVWRGASGYSAGFLAYSVHGVNYYKDQCLRLTQYNSWLAAAERNKSDNKNA